MKSRFTYTIFILIFLLSCKGNHRKLDISVNSDESRNIDTSMYKEPFDSIDLFNLKRYCDSIIQIALNDKQKSYSLTLDTFRFEKAKNVWFNYFDSDNLSETILIDFKLSQYSFTILRYKYDTNSSAINTLKKVETLQWLLLDGLIKSPNYIFRINNYLFWFVFPNTLFGPTLKKYNYKIDNIFDNKYPGRDLSENYSNYKKIKKLDNNKLIGKWKLKYSDDNNTNESINENELNNSFIIITDSSIIFNQKELIYNDIRRVELPDAGTFLYYDDFMEKYSDVIMKGVKEINGDFIWYKFYFKIGFLDMEAERINLMFRNLYIFNKNLYCYSINNKIYKLENN